MIHPCLSCGACCSFFRVSFHWSEIVAEVNSVPGILTTTVSPCLNAMIGTETSVPRCTALQGVIGKAVACEIYENRPSPCRSFKASFEDGENHEACDRARLGKGLGPLTLATWI